MNRIVYTWIWYSGILWFGIILLKTVFSCLDVYWGYPGIFLEFLYCILSWLRGYFHVSIGREFSCLDREGIFMSRSRGYFQPDLIWTWPLFGQVSSIMIASVFFLMNIKEELNLTFIWSSVSLKGNMPYVFWLLSIDRWNIRVAQWKRDDYLSTSNDASKKILGTKFF